MGSRCTSGIQCDTLLWIPWSTTSSPPSVGTPLTAMCGSILTKHGQQSIEEEKHSHCMFCHSPEGGGGKRSNDYANNVHLIIYPTMCMHTSTYPLSDILAQIRAASLNYGVGCSTESNIIILHISVTISLLQTNYIQYVGSIIMISNFLSLSLSLPVDHCTNTLGTIPGDEIATINSNH